MDYMLERERITVPETIYEGCQEQPVDLDVSLPDYCPDIQRILKCRLEPRISSRSIAGDRMMLDGSCRVRIFYLAPEGNTVRFYDADEAYSAEIPLKQQPENAQIFASPRVEYVNCRASGPRRLSVHGSFSLCARVVAMGQEEAVSSISGDDVEQIKTSVSLNQLTGLSQQQFSVDEVLELGQGKPPAESVIRAQASVQLQDCRAASGKLMTRGEAHVKVLYLSAGEAQSLETAEFSIPFTQMLDCDGAEDGCGSMVRFSVTGVDAQVKNDASGDSSYFDTQVKISASAQIYRKTDVTFVSDAFSRQYDLSIDSKPKTLECFSETLTDTFSLKNDLNAEDHAAAKVTDLWSEMASASAAAENGTVTVKGKYSLCVLAEDEKGVPFYFERLLDFERQLPCTSAGDLRCSAEVSAENIGWRISGSGVEARSDLRLCVDVYQRVSFRAISEVTADETKPAPKDTAASLCLYFAEAGESVWNIAREYRTSPEAVRAENGISGDAVESRGLLMIPV